MNLRNITTWAVILLSVFLIGFLPQYLKLRTAREQLASSRQQQALCETRDLMGFVLLETIQKNYGLAGQYSSRLFERVRQTLGQTQDPDQQKVLREILDSRDSITAGLARGDASILSPVEDLYQKLLQATGPLKTAPH